MVLLAANTLVQAQPITGPERFRNEVSEIVSGNVKKRTDIVLFTGSSSIRMWSDLSSYFPGYHIVNRGFGGSQTTDLLYFVEPIILSLRPAKIFIYEGDNDLAAGKTSQQILATSDSLLHRIREGGIPANVPIYFISPKPSVARWNLKDKYIEHMNNLRIWARQRDNVFFIDGWTSLLDAQGNVLTDIFLEDNLHLNKKGYDRWAAGIKVFLP